MSEGKPLAVLVTGTRHGLWPVWAPTIKDRFSAIGPIDALIHGDAPGIDTIAAKLADQIGCPRILTFSARWGEEGKKAGPIRNRKMLAMLLKLRDDEGYRITVEAFHHDVWHSSGTHHMATIALEAAERSDPPFPVTLSDATGLRYTGRIVRVPKGTIQWVNPPS